MAAKSPIGCIRQAIRQRPLLAHSGQLRAFSGHCKSRRWMSHLGRLRPFKWALSAPVSQMWAGLDCSYHFQRLLDLG